ncbi:MAG: MFS transporter [Intrasporangium sp.]|uniref:MFS transporter n=1 Tax=Intrasporangium sp. TaxID=1925024 RepID=UPI003F81E892
MPQPTTQPRLWPLYAGGFLGPFGGAMVTTMLPELSSGLHTSTATAASALTWYMVPFAGLMVVSGTIAARWGEAQTVRRAYVLYAAASAVCVVASSSGPFLLGRALQGAANAFTTPLLISMIAALAPHERMGRSLGTYASMQGAGQAFAPLIGGAAAGWDYRIAFGASALAALVLAVVTPSMGRRETTRPVAGRWGALLNRRLGQVAGTAFTMQFASTGLMLLAALVASDRFGLSPAERGLVVAAFGVAGLLTGTASGHLADRLGLIRVGGSALVLLGVSTGFATDARWLWLLVVLTALAGVAATAVRVLTQTLGVRSTPANPSGAMSATLAVQFLGTAVAPVLLAIYDASAFLAGLATGLVALLGAVLITSGRDEAVPRPRGH